MRAVRRPRTENLQGLATTHRGSNGRAFIGDELPEDLEG
jgi:hypothetical protein